MYFNFIDSKQETTRTSFPENLVDSDGLPGCLLLPIVLSGLSMGYLLLAGRWRPQTSHVRRITLNVCENSSFQKMTTIAINLIQLHYFDDVINEFNLTGLE